jgi:hypothetical protein
MNTYRSTKYLVLLLVLYLLVVRRIFAWVLFLTRGDTFLLWPSFSFSAPTALITYAIGVVCVVGLTGRQVWAWWLSVALVAYELATFGPSGVSGLEASPVGLGNLVKLLWLVALAYFLYGERVIASNRSQGGAG